MKYLFYFLHFFISFKHDFHVDAVRMIVRMYDIWFYGTKIFP